MKKLIGILCVLVLGAGVVFAGSSGLDNGVTKFTRPSLGNDDGLEAKVKTFNDAVVTWADTVETELDGEVSCTTLVTTGDATIGGAITVGTKATLTAVSVTDTNGYVITGASSCYILDASGQSALGITNTLSDPTVAGTMLYVANNGASNAVYITEGTSLDAGGAVTLTVEDAAVFIARGTNAWSLVSISVN